MCALLTVQITHQRNLCAVLAMLRYLCKQTDCDNKLPILSSSTPYIFVCTLNNIAAFPLKFKRFLIQAQRPDFNISLLPHKRINPSMLTGIFSHPHTQDDPRNFLRFIYRQLSLLSLMYLVTSDCRSVQLKVHKNCQTSVGQQREILRTRSELLL
jgi:hypothetical protein